MHTLYLLSSYQFRNIDFPRIFQEASTFSLVVLTTDTEVIAAPARPYLARTYQITKEPRGVVMVMKESEILRCIQQDMKEHPSSEVTIFSFDDDYMGAVLRLTHALSARQLSTMPSAIFFDKLVMKAHMQAHHCQTPQVLPVSLGQDDHQQFHLLQAMLGLPFILKPVNSAGSFDVSLIQDEAHFIRASTRAQTTGFDYEAEQYIHGTLFHCDFAFFAGQITYQACGQYMYPVMEAKPNKIVGSVMLPETDAQGQSVLGFARRCVDTLDINTGVLHMEIFRERRTGQLFFLEMGFRPPGLRSMNRMADQTLYTYMMRLLTQPTAPAYQSIPGDLAYGGGVCPPPVSGKVLAIQRPQHIHLQHCTLLSAPGDQVDLAGLRYIRVLEFDTHYRPTADVWDAMQTVERRDYLQIEPV